MRNEDLYRLVALEIVNATARIIYADGRGVDLSGGLAVGFDEIKTLADACRAHYRAWLSRLNEPDEAKRSRLGNIAGAKMLHALRVVSSWGHSPSGAWCEIDGHALGDAGALVLVCHSPDGVARRVDFSYYFGRG